MPRQHADPVCCATPARAATLMMLRCSSTVLLVSSVSSCLSASLPMTAVALDLVTGVLEPLTRLGVTVVCVLQQPRPEIFSRLQHVILMQEGGCAFEGPPAAVAPYLSSLGFEQPDDASDADFAVDVLNGLVGRRRGATELSSPGGNDLTAAWLARVNAAGSTPKAGASGLPVTSASAASHAEAAAGSSVSTSDNTDSSTMGVGFWRLVWLQAARAMASRLRSRGSIVIYALLHILMAAALSAGFSILIQGSYYSTLSPPISGALLGYCPSVLGSFCNERNVQDIGLSQLLFFSSSAIGIASALATVPLFGGQVPIIRREAGSGLHPLAYVLGRLTADVIFTCWYACLFTGAWMLFGHAGHWYGWLCVVVPTAFAAAGIGAAVVACTGGQSLSAAVVSVV